MSKLKEVRAAKKADKQRKKLERGNVTSINQYKRQVPKNYWSNDNKLVVSHEEIAGRCMTSADMLLKQTNGKFLRLWGDPESIPLCYMLFAYHQNSMITQNMGDADVIVEMYEKDEDVPILGANPDALYISLFKENEGIMPWME